MSTKKRRGRPKLEGEKKITRSIRMKPSIITRIEEKWVTVQKWIDFNVKKDIGGPNGTGNEEEKEK